MRRTHNLSGVQVRLELAGGLKYFENMAASGVGVNLHIDFLTRSL